MADYRLPGPACASQQTLLTDDGRLPRDAGCPRGPLRGAAAGHASDLDPRTLLRRAAAVHEACAIGLARAPAAIVRETGLDDLPALAGGILQGALAMLAAVGATTLLGGAAGAAVGALAGGVGAAPGAAVGAKLGLDAGIAVLGWMGLAFLAVAIGRGLGEVSGMVVRAVGQAWDAEGTTRRAQEVDAAGQLFADAVGRLMLFIVMAVVARLSAGQATGATGRAAASADELYAALGASRLGAGFAAWVQANAGRLLRDPRLRLNDGAGGTGARGGRAPTPSRLGQKTSAAPTVPVPDTPAPAPTAPVNPGVTAAAKGAEGAYTLRGANRAVIDPRKLSEYALNPAHPVGGNKARVFESVLGFTKSNADDLLEQLRQGVMNNPAVAGKVDRFGARFTVDIPVAGPAGNGIVRSGWIYKPGSDTPELTTIFVK